MILWLIEKFHLHPSKIRISMHQGPGSQISPTLYALVSDLRQLFVKFYHEDL